MTKISTPAKMTKTPVKDLSMKMKKSPKQAEIKKEKLDNGTPKPKNKLGKTPIKDMKVKKEKPAAVTTKKEETAVVSPKKSEKLDNGTPKPKNKPGKTPIKDMKVKKEKPAAVTPKKSEKPAKRQHNKEIKSKGESPAKNGISRRKKKVYEYCVFVGGLFYATTLEKVELLFKQFGKVLDVTMPMSRNKDVTHNKGYAFVSFVSKASMDKALAKSKQLTLDTKKLSVQIKNKPPTAEERNEKKLNKKLAVKLINNTNKIFVAKLKRTTTKKVIADHFSKYGAVSKVILPTLKDKRNRGFCFVSYKERTSMEAALSEEQHKIEDTELDVQPAALKMAVESSDDEDVDDEDEDVEDEDVDDEDEDVDDEDVDDEDEDVDDEDEDMDNEDVDDEDMDDEEDEE